MVQRVAYVYLVTDLLNSQSCFNRDLNPESGSHGDKSNDITWPTYTTRVGVYFSNTNLSIRWQKK
jgi:hypothetical protein